MSFSWDVKKELEGKIDSAKHCQIAEFAAIMGFLGRIRRRSGGVMELELITENEIVIGKFLALLKCIFFIDASQVEVTENGVRIYEQEHVGHILMTLKWCDDEFTRVEPLFVHNRIVQKECCKKAFIRGAFLAAGSLSDPNKFYHYEIVCGYEEDAESLQEMFTFFGLDAKYIERKKAYVVYLKEGNNITDALNLMGAFVSQMNLYNIMILKGISNDINRKVNCETANLNKTVAAAVKQTNDITYIRDTVGLNYLNDNLREIAVLRMENPDIALKALGEMLDPPVGKSGVNHRLRKISEIAARLRGE